MEGNTIFCTSFFWESIWLVLSGSPCSIFPSFQKGLRGKGSNSILDNCNSFPFAERLFNFITGTKSALHYIPPQRVLQAAVKLWEQRGVYIPLTVQSACYAHCWDSTRDPELYRSSRKRPLKPALEYIHRCGCVSGQGQNAANLAAQENFNSL